MASLTSRQASPILDDLVRQGATIEARSKSARKLTFPDGSFIMVHSSPSDTNWFQHLRRATIKAGLHWPGEDRKKLKRILKGTPALASPFITEYGAHAAESVSQEVQDRLLRELEGKSEARIPVLVKETGISQPTVLKAMIRIGWLQKTERKIEAVESADGKRTGATRAYWAPASPDVMASVVFKGKDIQLVRGDNGRYTARPLKPKTIITVPVEEPVVDVDTPQAEPVKLPEPMWDEADVVAAAQDAAEFGDTEALEEIGLVPAPTEKSEEDWFAEAGRQEARAVEAEAKLKASEEMSERRRARLEEVRTERDRFKAQLELRPVVTATDSSWEAPGISELPENTTVAELFSTLRLMGLEPQIRLSRKGEN